MTTLPPAFINRMRAQLGEEADAFFLSFETPPPVSIRLHHLKGRTPFSLSEKVPWCDTGYYLDTRPSFHLDPHWHAGAYYVQEASSMILDEVLRQLALDDKPKIWIDLCAAPGGKTGILARHMKTPDILIANEVVPQRRHVLRENMTKAGYLNSFLTGEPASSFGQPIADIMLIDAPCAGEGMMRKDPEAVDQWNEGLVRACSRLQQEIVHQAAAGVNPQGYLIYSTCSYSMEENIQNVSRFIEQYGFRSVPLSFPDHFQVRVIYEGRASGYQLYPHLVRGEGLFISVLQNPAESTLPASKPRNQASFFQSLPPWLSRNLKSPEQFVVRKNNPSNELLTADAISLANKVIPLLPRAELVVQAGELKGKDFIPSHALAMSGVTGVDTPGLDLDLQQALDYLERQTASLVPAAQPGWHLIRHDGSGLGWAKYTAQGWKNYYPMAWRLRKRYPS